jgi:hypothetical protein
VAYDVELADRLRAILSAEKVTEKRMFGGLAFLLGTRLAVSASGSGGLLVRVDPDRWATTEPPHLTGCGGSAAWVRFLPPLLVRWCERQCWTSDSVG